MPSAQVSAERENKTDPNVPLMSWNHFDFISLTPEYPVAANSIGAGNHAAVRVDNYYSVYYPSGSYSWNGSIPLTTTVSQWGYSQNPQMLYSHIGHNQVNDAENWLHFEQDELPNVITENILSFYDADGNLPTYRKYANSVAYYHPLYEAIVKTMNVAPVWTNIPVPISAAETDIVQFTVGGSDADGDVLTISYQGDLHPAAQFTDNGDGSGSLYWQTDYIAAGSYTATFQISDGFSNVTANVPITVNNVNRAPVLAGIGNQSADEGIAFYLTYQRLIPMMMR